MGITPQQRKECSIRLLKKQHVPVLKSLPPIEPADELRRRSCEEIAKRAVCSLLTIQVACDFLQESDMTEAIPFFKNILKQFGVEEHLTAQEKHIFSGSFSRQEAIDAVWRYESYWVLLWALGKVDELSYPSATCNCDYAVNAISEYNDMESFLASVKLRSMDEIMDMADLTYRYDWACVEARINGKDAPAGLDGGVVMERHKGFSWLLDFMGEDDWDSPEIST